MKAESLFSHMGPGGQSQVVRLGGSQSPPLTETSHWPPNYFATECRRLTASDSSETETRHTAMKKKKTTLINVSVHKPNILLLGLPKSVHNPFGKHRALVYRDSMTLKYALIHVLIHMRDSI